MANNFADLFEHAVDAMPDRIALISGGRRVSYIELERRANQLADYFGSLGVGAGTHIGFQMHNSIETVEMWRVLGGGIDFYTGEFLAVPPVARRGPERSIDMAGVAAVDQCRGVHAHVHRVVVGQFGGSRVEVRPGASVGPGGAGTTPRHGHHGAIRLASDESACANGSRQ
ncbi:AMP-binding protein [Nocardia sp. NBC_00565]|uniref:AMP-binding protein n=1 Tax=Nocardia sp. NBC_00565 TaxID=2975993 RepID=UPI002E822B2E|nr:AMP-binding protein [Nocardia sp. NBC_00565]WUC04689.1 AMP-binding protein [Nocardia sp. NBC_00565]